MSNQYTDDNENYTEAVGTRLTPQMKERFDVYKDENQLGNSQALRRIIETGLDAEQDGREIVDTNATIRRDQLTLASFMAATMFLLVQLAGTDPNLASAIGGAYIMLTLLWAFWPMLARPFE